MSAPASATQGLEAYRDGNALRWLIGFGLSLLGTQVYFIALGWTAAQITTAADAGLIVAAGSVPRVAVLIVGGAIADRFGAKRLVILSDTSRTVIMLALACILLVGRPSVIMLLALAVAFGIVDGLFLPATGSLPPRLVDREELARLQAMRSTVQRASIVIGAPLAGWVVAQYGISAAFSLNVVLFGFSVLALALTSLRPRRSAVVLDEVANKSPKRSLGHETLLADVAAGVRYVRSHGLLAPLLLVIAVSEFGFTGPVNVGLPLLAKAQDWSVAGVGWVLGGFGAGAAGTSLAIVFIGRLPRAGLLCCLSIPPMGAAAAAIGFASTVWWATAAAFILGLGSGIIGSLLNALVQTVTEMEQLGRVMALSTLATSGSMPISFALTGFLAGATTPGFTFIIGGALSALSGVAGIFNTNVRRAELPP